MKIWPFAIAVGKYEDYDFVVRPDLFTDKTRNVWRQPEFGANRPSDGIRRFKAKLEAGRDIEFIYRTSKITTAIGDVLDSGKRPVFKSVGFIIQDQCSWSDTEIKVLLESFENEFRPIINEYIEYVSPPLWHPKIIGPRAYPPLSPPPTPQQPPPQPPQPKPPQLQPRQSPPHQAPRRQPPQLRPSPNPFVIALLVSLLLNLALVWASYRLWSRSHTAQATTENFQQETGNLQKEIGNLQQKAGSLQKEVSNLQQDNGDLREKNNELDQQNKQLQKIIQERQIENTAPKSDEQK
jgi:hypothetical protein